MKIWPLSLGLLSVLLHRKAIIKYFVLFNIHHQDYYKLPVLTVIIRIIVLNDTNDGKWKCNGEQHNGEHSWPEFQISSMSPFLSSYIHSSEVTLLSSYTIYTLTRTSEYHGKKNKTLWTLKYQKLQLNSDSCQILKLSMCWLIKMDNCICQSSLQDVIEWKQII